MNHLITFRSFGACQLCWRIVYKHFVPTGLRTFAGKLFSPQEQDLNGALPSLEIYKYFGPTGRCRE